MTTHWTTAELAVFASLQSPGDIQSWLDGVPYSTDPVYRCPRSVMQDRRAHCFDGAVFASAAMERLGFPPTLVDLRAERDDDHVLAVFRVDGHWGAIAKSNFVGLRYRDPVFRTLRELALSYFDGYFNLDRERSLRAVSVGLDLNAVRVSDWRTRDEAMDHIARHLDSIRHFPLMSAEMIQQLRMVDERSFRGHMYGTDPAGVVDPSKVDNR